MRRMKLAGLGLAAMLATAVMAFPQANPRGFSQIDLNGRYVSVFFGRPSLKSRTIDDLLGELRPGSYWRLGADESTTLTTMTALKFGNVTVSHGTYSIWAKRNSNGTWDLVFNHQYGQWGTLHDAAKDFASVPLKETRSGSTEQKMNITLTKEGDGGAFRVHWGNMELTTHFTAG